jgi:alpha-beta hydrolase superfamily lysophospholipase
MTESTFMLEASDGQQLCGYHWLPSGDPIAVVQLAHGASEHAARYGLLARALVDAGYGLYATDHRGHGRTAADHGRFGVARPGGWDAMVTDARQLTEHISRRHPDVAVVLMGHSMGSMLAQAYLQRWGGDLAGAVLSGTTGGLGLDEATLAAIVAMGEGDGAGEPSEIFSAMFAGFNEAFDGPEATSFEWLSRDKAEVQAYVDDPWCGQPLSNGFVADMLAAMSDVWTGEAEARIPPGLPLYVFSGVDDPVGGVGAESVRNLVARYEKLGVGPITLRLYEGGRHEMLNEINREEVHADLLAWLEALEV